jgi:hypothetical protein
MLLQAFGGSLPRDPGAPAARAAGRFWIFLDALALDPGGNGKKVLAALLLATDGAQGQLLSHAQRGAPEEGWRSLLIRLREEERVAPALICCDGHPAVIKAIRAVYPDALVQISVSHRLRALGKHLDPRWRGRCLAEGRRIFSAPDRPSAILRFRGWRDRWLGQGEKGVRTLEGDLAWCLTFYRFPPVVRRSLRTLRPLRLAMHAARRTPAESSDPAPTPGPQDDGAIMSPPPPGDQAVVYVDDLISDPTFVQWLQQYRRDRLRLVQTASAVASAVALAARLLGRGPGGMPPAIP